MKYTFGLHKSPVRKTDYLIAPLLIDVFDEVKDISYRDEQTPVKNQKKLGACVGFSGVGVKEWQELKETGKEIDLSEMWLYEKARQRGGYQEGANLADCFYILSHEGVCLEKHWPYTDDKTNIGKPDEKAESNARIYRIHDKLYFRLTNPSQIRATLIKFGPFQLGITVYKNWYRQKEGHIPTASICERIQGVRGGHAIEVTGDLNSTKEYEFKNSWGSWGDLGYGYITYAEMKKSFMDAFVWVDLPNVDSEEIMTVADLSGKEQKKLMV